LSARLVSAGYARNFQSVALVLDHAWSRLHAVVKPLRFLSKLEFLVVSTAGTFATARQPFLVPKSAPFAILFESTNYAKCAEISDLGGKCGVFLAAIL
jgi:hypothetical protein